MQAHGHRQRPLLVSPTQEAQIVRDYDVKRKTALAMAMHRRLGSESLLATLGDVLPFVSELM